MMWYLKQLFPCTYQSSFTDGNGKHEMQWKMWFGKCYNVKDSLC